MTVLTFHEVDAARWDDFEQLFESKGGPKACWCMVWRNGASSSKGPDGKVAMQEIICSNTPVGLLGYNNGEPIAWCSIAPREKHRELGGLRQQHLNENVWSLTCMFLARKFRGSGMANQLIEAAISHAANKGATVVEAYPVDADSPSYLFMGFVDIFLAHGFEEVGRAGTRRHVMRRNLQ